MSIGLLKIISMGALGLSGVSFMISVFLFIRLDIKKIIGDLSGFGRRKAIEQIYRSTVSPGETTKL